MKTNRSSINTIILAIFALAFDGKWSVKTNGMINQSITNQFLTRSLVKFNHQVLRLVYMYIPYQMPMSILQMVAAQLRKEYQEKSAEIHTHKISSYKAEKKKKSKNI